MSASLIYRKRCSMGFKSIYGLCLFAMLSLSALRPAHAQFAVIDVASIVQLVQEVEQLQQQVATAKSQLAQAQSEYAAITGNRGMEQLLSGTVRNYLPPDWTQLSQVMAGSSGSFPALAGDVAGLLSANAILTPARVAALSPAERLQLTTNRQAVALLQATSRSALANSSSRFTSLQQLIGAIGGAGDEKAALDLTARIAAEQGMLQNEQTKLQILSHVAQAEDASRVQRVREQALADQGSLRQLPRMGL
jgi:type IV secretion system protein VirB5